MATVYLGLGSNLGNRQDNIEKAIFLLNQKGVALTKLSTIIETDPVGGPPQGLFLNAVMQGETNLSPENLLDAIHAIESGLGRVRTVKDGPRTIDIDILFYDDLILRTEKLTIPHPRIKERDFVMRPLREIGKIY